MSTLNRRERALDRRSVPRGGRRATDKPGWYPTVLVAESYQSVRQMLVQFLNARHFRVEEAINGRQVLAELQTVTPAVIVTEQGLPGLAALRELGEDAGRLAWRQIPTIVMMSEDSPDTLDSLPGHLSGVVVKPFRLETLLEEVRRALRTR